MRPSGEYQMEDLFYAGGIPAVLKQLLSLLHGDALTVTGRTLAENVADAEVSNPDVIRSLRRTAGGGGRLEHPAGQPGALMARSSSTPPPVLRFASIADRLSSSKISMT